MRWTNSGLPLLAWILVVHWTSCQAQFREGIEVGSVRSRELDEASGLAASWRNEGVLWTHNDQGDYNVFVHALTVDGDYLGSYMLEGVVNWDTEDIAVSWGPKEGQSYIYVGDTGNNGGKFKSRDEVFVYRVKEPRVPRDGSAAMLTDVDTITLNYPTDRDDINAETLMIDPIKGVIYLVTKETDTNGATVYSTDPEAIFKSGSFTLTLKERGRIRGSEFEGLTGGDISRTGREILIKSASRIFYFQREETDLPISESLIEREGFRRLPYQGEIKGEAITFAPDLYGYYTISESREENRVPLFYYPRDGPVPEFAAQQLS